MSSSEENKVKFKKRSKKALRKRQILSDEDDNEDEEISIRLLYFIIFNDK